MIESHAPSALRRWLLGCGCVVALLALVFWRPLEQRCLLHFLLRSDAPSPQVLTEAVEDAGDPGSVLERLWLTQRISHRQFVLSYLGQTSPAKPDLFRAMEPAVLAAAGDADVQARELALAVLVRMKHPALRRLALAQLANLDPAVRLLGMQSLRSIATANDVPIAMRLLLESAFQRSLVALMSMSKVPSRPTTTSLRPRRWTLGKCAP